MSNSQSSGAAGVLGLALLALFLLTQMNSTSMLAAIIGY